LSHWRQNVATIRCSRSSRSKMTLRVPPLTTLHTSPRTSTMMERSLAYSTKANSQPKTKKLNQKNQLSSAASSFLMSTLHSMLIMLGTILMPNRKSMQLSILLAEMLTSVLTLNTKCIKRNSKASWLKPASTQLRLTTSFSLMCSKEV
jgi:hypothetical protein